MEKKNFILSSIFLFLLTSCDNKNNKIEVKKTYDSITEKCNIKIDLPELNENTKYYVFEEKNYASEYNYNCLEGYNIIKEIINASDFYITSASKGGNHSTGLGYTFDNGYKILFNQRKFLESSKYYTDCYMYWIRTTELDKIEDSHDYLIEYKGIYKSDELFYRFFNFHEQAMNNSYNKKFDDGFYGF